MERDGWISGATPRIADPLLGRQDLEVQTSDHRSIHRTPSEKEQKKNGQRRIDRSRHMSRFIPQTAAQLDVKRQINEAHTSDHRQKNKRATTHQVLALQAQTRWCCQATKTFNIGSDHRCLAPHRQKNEVLSSNTLFSDAETQKQIHRPLRSGDAEVLRPV